jgi:hypothetical protein
MTPFGRFSERRKEQEATFQARTPSQRLFDARARWFWGIAAFILLVFAGAGLWLLWRAAE